MAVVFHCVGGHGDDSGSFCARRFGFVFADAFGGLVAVQFGHLAVHEYDGEGSLGKQGEGFEAVVGDDGFVAELLEGVKGDGLVNFVVFHNEDVEVFDGGLRRRRNVSGRRVAGGRIFGFVCLLCRLKAGKELSSLDGFGEQGVDAAFVQSGSGNLFSNGREEKFSDVLPSRHGVGGGAQFEAAVGGDIGIDNQAVYRRFFFGAVFLQDSACLGGGVSHGEVDAVRREDLPDGAAKGSVVLDEENAEAVQTAGLGRSCVGRFAERFEG